MKWKMDEELLMVEYNNKWSVMALTGRRENRQTDLCTNNLLLHYLHCGRIKKSWFNNVNAVCLECVLGTVTNKMEKWKKNVFLK